MSTDATRVAWLAIWNRELAASTQDGDSEDAQGSEADSDQAGILYTSVPSGTDSNSESIAARRIGLAQGLVDFTRCVLNFCIHRGES